MITRTVRVVVLEVTDHSLEFDLIFDDNSVKRHKLDRYQIKSFRGASIRDIISHLAEDFYMQLDEHPVTIMLVFS